MALGQSWFSEGKTDADLPPGGQWEGGVGSAVVGDGDGDANELWLWRSGLGRDLMGRGGRR
jgi:hypothetical protein